MTSVNKLEEFEMTQEKVTAPFENERDKMSVELTKI